MQLDYERLLHFFIYSVICSFLFITLINNKYKKTKIVLLVTNIIFYALQAMSFLTIMWDINYHFIKNLFEPTNYTVAFTTYREYTWLAVGVIILLSIVIYFMTKKLTIKNNKIRIAIMIFCFLFLLTPYSLTNRFYHVIFNIFHNPSYKLDHKEIFKQITNEDFIDKKDLKSQIIGQNKNLIIIFMESFEQNFLDEKNFSGISDNIRSLSKEGEFYSSIRQIEGSSWTMAGMHTALCGSPEIYSVRKNKVFKTVSISNLTCLSDVLKNSGYYQLYLGGEFKTFAGKSFFLEMHGYNKTYGDKEIFAEMDIKQEDRWGWGAKDYDVFKLAKKKYLELSKLNQPFNLTISTIAPHAPAGIYDSRCKNKYSNSTINAIQCDDELLGDFINFIKKQDNYKNTLILILPDHLLMASNATEFTTKVNSDRRNYGIILNADKNKIFNDKILYTDFPRIILEKLNIKHNAKFLLDNYKNQTTEERINFINNNIEKIRNFNDKTAMH